MNDLTLAMSCSKAGGGGCVSKYDSAENKVNVDMMGQRQAVNGARERCTDHLIGSYVMLCYSERNLSLSIHSIPH
jgi:hypothetical protein